MIDPEFANSSAETKWMLIRQERNARLTNCDWTQLADADLLDEERAAWAAYRQQLRDLPDAFASPEDVVWPIRPK